MMPQAPLIPDEALNTDVAILGKKGRGKSYAAKGLVERMLDLGERVLILDPLGHWWGLKASFNGHSNSRPVCASIC
jgi:DNA helicase HerA-like ATPase